MSLLAGCAGESAARAPGASPRAARSAQRWIDAFFDHELTLVEVADRLAPHLLDAGSHEERRLAAEFFLTLPESHDAEQVAALARLQPALHALVRAPFASPAERMVALDLMRRSSGVGVLLDVLAGRGLESVPADERAPLRATAAEHLVTFGPRPDVVDALCVVLDRAPPPDARLAIEHVLDDLVHLAPTAADRARLALERVAASPDTALAREARLTLAALSPPRSPSARALVEAYYDDDLELASVADGLVPFLLGVLPDDDDDALGFLSSTLDGGSDDQCETLTRLIPTLLRLVRDPRAGEPGDRSWALFLIQEMRHRAAVVAALREVLAGERLERLSDDEQGRLRVHAAKRLLELGPHGDVLEALTAALDPAPELDSLDAVYCVLQGLRAFGHSAAPVRDAVARMTTSSDAELAIEAQATLRAID